jgi:arsenite methyltransferase
MSRITASKARPDMPRTCLRPALWIAPLESMALRWRRVVGMTGSFLDMQAHVGITKHIGGLPATKTLLARCHVEQAVEVLEVGCGIGVGPARTARMYDCRVVGVDISERMIEWSRRRAREEGVEDRIELVVANVLALPFESGRFDATLCESVLAFVDDKEQAIRELVRVTKPGGYVGLNEAFLLTEAPSPAVAELARQMGTEMVTLDAWRKLWEGSGLRDRSAQAYRIDPGREVRGRMRWIGMRWLVRGWARALRAYATQPSLRPALATQLGAARDTAGEEPGAPSAWASFGYGLFVGRK